MSATHHPTLGYRLLHSRITAGLSIFGVFAMLGLSFASVPLYRMFCQATGYEGTTQVAKQAPGRVAARSFTIQFNADTAPELPWNFKPEQRKVKVKAGEEKLVYYTAQNLGSEPVTGTATYNVTPESAGIYFNKIQCFCFTRQTLQPGQKVDMPVTFFVDPDVVKDPNLKGVTTITLSYTFFKTKAADKPVVSLKTKAANEPAAG